MAGGEVSAVEKAVIETDLARERSLKAPAGSHSVVAALRDPRVYVIGLVGCGTYTLANAVSFWSPLIISASGVKNILDVGLLGAISPAIGIIVMFLVGRSSDRTLERRWHAACSEFAAAAALVALAFVHEPYLVVALIAVMTAGHYAGLTVFWSVPSIYLSDRAKAGGIALTTAMGSFAAAIMPAVLGFIRVETGSLSGGLLVSAAVITLGALVLLIGVPARSLREGPS